MNDMPRWWPKPRIISVVVDNPSWILPYAEQLVLQLTETGDTVHLCRTHAEVVTGAVAFYLGCMQLTPPEVLARNQRNLIVHESDLPQRRGFSPLTWQILEGRNDIPVCLLEAAGAADAGPVVYRETLRFKGHELIDELRSALGRLTIELCIRYLDEKSPPIGQAQSGTPTQYSRRRPEDSRLDPDRSLAEQFNLLRVVDNSRYPAFFELHGQRYTLNIEKMPASGNEGESP